jgi:hypothetical protein
VFSRRDRITLRVEILHTTPEAEADGGYPNERHQLAGREEPAGAYSVIDAPGVHSTSAQRPHVTTP